MKALAGREDLVFSPPAPGVVLFLPGLPGGSGKIHDRSPHANTGAITGATWKRLPGGLWHLSFDGTDDYAQCGIAGLPTGNNPFTIEAWLRTTKNGAQTAVMFGTLALNQAAQITIYTGKPLFNIYNNAPNVWGPAGYADGRWHHLAGTNRLSGSTNTLQLYVDGIYKNEGTTATQNIATNRCRIGTDIADNPADDWDGDIALVRIHNRALSALEIRNHFDREKELFGVW